MMAVGIPNALTLLRIGLIPIFIIIFYLPFVWAHYAAAFVFLFASVTDILDGYLARKLKQISSFGTFLDPVADKLLVASSLLLLLGVKEIEYITLPAIIIVGREIVISALREWMAELGLRASVAVSWMGKIKTCTQMIAIALLILFPPFASWYGFLGFILLYVAAILTMWSMVIYLHMAWPQMNTKKLN
jgi:CDP-diacylglycerol---glycerol-3-phosphate 3-phosphatidyltransferase